MVCLYHRGLFHRRIFSVLRSSPLLCLPVAGTGFFSRSDAGQFKLHVRALPARASKTPRRFAITWIRRMRRDSVPKDELRSIIDNIGLPYSGINLSYSNSAPVGPGTRISWSR